MDAHRKQMTKSNRVTVPFYSPPTRHYGQTPSEIIREARASVMGMSSPDIRPVVTDRPFTPKEKERTLFGNVKKRLSRPPSSFSLSYLQKQDPLPRIKLPAIASQIDKKITQPPTFRSVHSLDNLLEEYESEILEEPRESDSKDLPHSFRKSHSSPQERRSTRKSSSSEKATPKVPDKRSIYTISQNFDSNLSIPRTALLDGKSINSEEPGRIALDFSECRTKNESSSPIERRSRQMDLLHVRRLADRNAEPDAEKDEKSPPRKEQESLRDDDRSIATRAGEGTGNAHLPRSERTPLVGDGNADKKAEISAADAKKADEDGREAAKCVDAENVNIAMESRAEKCTATEFASQYLTMMNDNKCRSSKTQCETRKTKEILELYETANYYGVAVDDGSRKDADKCDKSAGKASRKGETKKASRLDAMKENIRIFDEKMRQLNHSIENFEEKLKGGVASLSAESDVVRANRVKSRDEREEFVADRVGVGEASHGRSIAWDGFWKSSYYRQKGGGGEEDEGRSPEGGENFDEILQKLMLMKEGNAAEDREVIDASDELYRALKRGGNVLAEETKRNMLRIVYTFADREDPRVLLNLARIVFALRMDNSLSAACKMVFKVARSDSNDHLFLEIEDALELLLNGIGLASPLDAAESCIYGYGAIKFLTMNQRILRKLINIGVLDLLVLHIKLINSAKVEGVAIEEQTLHALFQLTGAVRNIAATEGASPLFITTNSIPVLCEMLHRFRQCEDLVTNVSRTLSLLSADEDAANVLASVDNILRIMVELIEQYKSDEKILIRLSYCLGNVVAYSDLARVRLSRSEGSVAALLDVLRLYVDEQGVAAKCDAEKGATADDIVVKIIRIIANMCMNPVVGSNLSPAEGNDKNSFELSHLLTVVLRRKDPGIALVACLGCLNNISYYCNDHSSLVDVAEGIVRVLGLPDEECQAEAARVLGNLTRHKEIRDLIGSTDGLTKLFALLDSNDKEVYRSACGALVNLLLDAETRTIFIESHGIDKLVRGLERFSGDWSFSGLVCRALWNSCADDVKSWMSHNNVKKLLTTLANSLDEDNWNDGDASWEEFALLATDILEKINAHLEVL